MERNPEVLYKEASDSWSRYVSTHGLPDAVVAEVTNICDCADCAHCYLKAVRTNQASSLGILWGAETADTWSKVLSSHENGKPVQIWITGGEPTLNESLDTISEKFKRQGFYTALITNGEKLADKEYCDRLLRLNVLDEMAISIRGVGVLHDLLMLPVENQLWNLVDHKLSSREQIEEIKKQLTGKMDARRFEKSMKGLINCVQHPVKIGLNIDIQAATDMNDIVEEIIKRGGKVDVIYLQVMQESGRAVGQQDLIPNLWRKPDQNMVEEYLSQAHALLERGIVQKIEIIDPLPNEIVKNLNLEGETIYQPIASPAISPEGKLREDVLFP